MKINRNDAALSGIYLVLILRIAFLRTERGFEQYLI
jgi:hypothetical protein